MPIDKILEEEMGKNDGGYKYEDDFYIDGYEKAVADLKSRIPQIKERIIEIVKVNAKQFMDEVDYENFINTLKGGKE